MLVVLHGTDNGLLAALAFGIGFIALTLASSELFTESFLVPVTAVCRGGRSLRAPAVPAVNGDHPSST